jgi:hypothetical protein
LWKKYYELAPKNKVQFKRKKILKKYEKYVNIKYTMEEN